MDVLVGQRHTRRFGVKVGVGCVVAEGEVDFVTKVLAVVSMGSL